MSTRLRWLKGIAGKLAFAIVLLALWELLSRTGLLSANTAPSVTDTVGAGIQIFSQGFAWDALWLTLTETALGFLFGTLAGIIVALLVAGSKIMNRALWPWVTFLANLPAVALAPIFVGILGFGLWSRVATAALICFFPIAINSLAGMLNRNRDIESVFSLLNASRAQVLFEFLIPNAAPGIFAGLKTGVSLAFIGAVVAEFVAGDGGVGVLIKDLTFQYQLGAAFFLVAVISVVGLVVYALFAEIEKRVIFWNG